VSPRLRCLGIYRELAHSPGRETDDAEILRATAGQLGSLGLDVELKTTEEITEMPDRETPLLVFAMCERPEALDRLESWERRGTLQVNSVKAIRNTYRDRTIPLLLEAGIPFPPSVIVSTRQGARGTSENSLPAGRWVKRADVHNTTEGDVLFAEDPAAVERALAGLTRRGIPKAVIQEHIAGDLIKFYGVEGWFQWFYHRDQQLSGYPFDPEALSTISRRAARALGLEIYGGDAIATAEGKIFVIDLNAWPSFALYRATAAQKIAAHLAARFRAHAAIGAQR
jgi:hypothetical protein